MSVSLSLTQYDKSIPIGLEHIKMGVVAKLAFFLGLVPRKGG